MTITSSLGPDGYTVSIQSPVSGGGALPTSAAWSTSWDTASYKDLGSHTVAGALAISSTDGGSVVGGCTQAVLVADGANVPSLDGTAATNYGYTNTTGAANLVQLFRAGDYKYWSVLPYVGAAVTSGATAPGQPTALTPGAVTTSTVALTWTAPASNGGASITSYTVQYSTDNSTWTTWGTSASTSATVTGLTDGLVYWFRVAATNSAGTGSYSSSNYAGTTAADYVRLSSLTLTTESGAGPYTYTAGSGASTSNSYAGVSNLSFPSGGSGWFDATITASANGFSGIGTKTTNTAGAYNTFEWFFYQSTLSSYIVNLGIVAQTKNGPDASLTPVTGDVLRIRIIGGTAMAFQVVRSGTVYTLHTATVSAAQRYVGLAQAYVNLAFQLTAHVGLT